ncbi:MAG TPA: DUF1736 domain-containing protein [Phycisphaerae bacterium]|nr:DUF1736 domain-containing protein [Phycisphaerae bacterium]
MTRTPPPITGDSQPQTRPTDHTPRRARLHLIALLILPIACLAVYANALTNPFHFDDISIILTDPRVQEFRTGELLTTNYWRHENTDRLYRPLTLLSYALNWSLSHQAWAFRIPNLILHAGVCLLLFELVRSVYGSFAAALAAGLAFAVHPLHTEPLNTIVGRADLLVTLLMLGAALLYWRDAVPDNGRRPLTPLAAAALLALALGCKENAVTLIAIVALLDWWRVQRGDVTDLSRFLRRRCLRAYLPMIALIALYLILRAHCIGALTGDPGVIDHFDNPIAHPADGLTEGDSVFLARWATPLATLAKAARLHLAPNRLCFDYSYAAIQTVRRIGDWRMWAGLGVVAAAVLACLLSHRHKRRVLLAIALSAVTYAIVANFLLIGTIFGERLLYLPSIGFCILIGLAADFAYRWPRAHPQSAWKSLAVLPAVGLPLMGLWYGHLTIVRNRDWSSPQRLYESAYRVNPTSCKVLSGMAGNALARGDLHVAHRFCRQATRLAPAYWPAWRTGALAVRRMADRQTNQTEKARLYETALEYYESALALGAAGDPAAMSGAAELYGMKGEYRRAIQILKQLVIYAPVNAQAFNDLAHLLVTAEPADLRNPQRALQCARRAMSLRPEVANYVATYVDVLLALGRRDEALTEIRKVLATLPPDSPGVEHFQKQLERMEMQPAPIPHTSEGPPP